MKKCFILLMAVCPLLANAQLNLQHAELIPGAARTGGFGVAEGPDKGYYVVEDYSTSSSTWTDINPDVDVETVVSPEIIQGGYYILHIDSNGKYRQHKALPRAANRTFAPTLHFSKNSLYIADNFTDSVELGGAGTGYIKQAGDFMYVAKYDENLNLQKTLFLKQGISEILHITELDKGNLLLNIIYQGDFEMSFANNTDTIFKRRPTNATQYHNVFIKIDSNFNYLSHYNFNQGGIAGNTIQTKYIDGKIVVTGIFVIYPEMIFGNDTIRRESQGPFPESTSLLLELDDNLIPIRHLNLKDRGLKSLQGHAVSKEKNNLFVGYQDLSRGGFYILLTDSNYNEINSAIGGAVNSGVATSILKFGTGYNTEKDEFVTVLRGPSIFLNGTGINLTITKQIALSVDSMKLIETTELNNNLQEILYSNDRGLLASFRIYGQQVMQKGYGESPDFKLGNPLNPTQERVGVARWDYDCKPIEHRLTDDSLSLCADEYGTNSVRGRMKVLAGGTGVTYQWYTAKDTTQELIDYDPRVQGGYVTQGAQTSELRVTSAAVGYAERSFRVKIGSVCQDAIWSDTILQRIWGTNRLYRSSLTPPTIIPDLGDTIAIDMYHNTEYIADSIYYKWFLGDKELTDKSKYDGLDSTSLRIKNISVEDAGAYSCGVYRYHCKEVNTQDLIQTNVFIEVNSISPSQASLGIKLYPNPTNGDLHLDYAEIPQSIEVFNSLGKSVIKLSLTDKTINTNQLEAGSYTIRLTYSDFATHLNFIKY